MSVWALFYLPVEGGDQAESLTSQTKFYDCTVIRVADRVQHHARDTGVLQLVCLFSLHLV